MYKSISFNWYEAKQTKNQKNLSVVQLVIWTKHHDDYLYVIVPIIYYLQLCFMNDKTMFIRVNSELYKSRMSFLCNRIYKYL